MARDRIKTKGRSEVRTFVQLYQDVLWHPNYIKMTNRAKGLLNDLLAHYNGSNNGDISACRTLMEKRGWNSASNLSLALKELIYYQFVGVSRQGGRNMPTLLALTFYKIDECGGKHDLRSTKVPPNNWKVTKKKFDPKRLQNRYPTGGSTVVHWRASPEKKPLISPQVGQ